VLQLRDVLTNGYWHARSTAYLSEEMSRLIEWIRLPGDLVFGIVGVLPAVLAIVLTYWYMRKRSG
jgi:nitric oxide reductase subunit B